MICKQCGNEISINDTVCAVCGAQVEFQTMLIDDEVQQPSEPQYAQPVQTQPQYAQTVEPQPQYAQPAEPQYAQPVQPQQAPPQPIQPEPIQAQPMRPQYEQSQPVPPQPVQPQPVPPQPIQPQYAQPQPIQTPYAQPQPVNQPITPEAQALLKGILGFGIAAVCCAEWPIASVLGIIFGAIAKNKAKAYDAMGYPSNGRRVAGKVLGIIGFISGIVMTVYWFIYIIAIASVL